MVLLGKLTRQQRVYRGQEEQCLSSWVETWPFFLSISLYKHGWTWLLLLHSLPTLSSLQPLLSTFRSFSFSLSTQPISSIFNSFFHRQRLFSSRYLFFSCNSSLFYVDLSSACNFGSEWMGYSWNWVSFPSCFFEVCFCDSHACSLL